MKAFPIIYKRTETGAIQIWFQEIEGSKIRTTYGHIDGKLVTTEWTECLPTNIGKKNFRDGTMQAEFEIKANYKKQLRIDYHEYIEDIDTPKIFEPMLAEKYKKWDGPYYSQPKLNGMRCIATSKGLWTRTGEPIVSIPVINEILNPLFEKNEGLVLDGELYNHEFKDDFNSLMSAFRKEYVTQEALDIVEYHIYDMPSSLNFSERFINLSELISDLNEKIILVPTHFVNTENELNQKMNDYLADGYEGQILRKNTPYENKRTKALQKNKNFIDEEFELVEINEGKGNWSGYAKPCKLRLKDGRTFGATLEGKREYCKEVLLNKEKYIGKLATVRFFQYTPDGIPSFGIVCDLGRKDL